MELNIVKQLKSYWEKFIGLSDAPNEEFVDAFADATSQNSVRTSKFLEGLNLDPIMPEINKHYSVSEGVETYPRRAMVKTMIFRKIKRIKFYTETARCLKNYLDEAIELGFNIDANGSVMTPDHETLRHFEKIRLGNDGMDAIMNAFCINVVKAGDKLDLKIGENTGTDSTPIEMPNDPAGTYNGYYEKKMVKAHITEDYDHNIPLAKRVCGGTDSDDQYLEFMLETTAMSAKQNMQHTWFDGGFNSNKNIALAHVKFDLIPHYHINEDWRENVTYQHTFKGKTYVFSPQQQINYLYRKLWQKPYYRKEASVKYMMQCLINEKIYEPVAIYFRNSYMREYEECPDGVLDVYHRRNGSEGINSYMKEHLGLKTHINGKGMKNIDIHVTQCCIALLAVALIRLQQGLNENLSSVAYLT